MTSVPELRPGQILDGKYEIVSFLGAGGMGEVYKARHVHLSAIRTIKVMRKTLLTDETYRQRFAREARLATRVQHPNVAMIHDFAIMPDGAAYMVSEFIEGLTLRQWSRKHGRFSIGLALEIARQALEGLEKIHRAGLLHRDISADNIMIASSADGQPLAKIIDLGIAKAIATAAEAVAGEGTQIGLFVGNPRYSSPEQLGALPDGEELDARSDIYCFGVVLFEMLAGEPPFSARTPQGYAAKHLTEAPPPLHEKVPEVPPGVEAAVMKALEKNRKNRFDSARELAAALRPHMHSLMSETTMMKLSALTGGSSAFDDTVHGQRASLLSVPSTLTPAPEPSHDFEDADRRVLEDIDRMAQSGDISGLSRLAGLHSMSTPVGKAVRAALDRMAEEAMRVELERERRDWNEAFELATEEAWASYLSHHPDSYRSREARRLRDEARDFGEASRAATTGAWRSFVGTWPDSRFRGEAERQLGILEEQKIEAAFAAAMQNGTADALTQFVTSYPQSKRADAARRRLDVLHEFERARTVAQWNDFLARHRGDALEAEAKRRLEAAIDREEEALETALAAGTMKALQALLATAAAPEVVARARAALATAEAFAEAERTNTAAAWRQFLAAHADSHLSERATARLHDLEERDAAAAREAADASVAERFLADFPDSAHAAAIADRLRALREDDAVQRAIAALSKGNPGRAERLLGTLENEELAATLRHQLDAYHEAQEWKKAESARDVPSISAFLEKYPESVWAPAARERLAAIEEQNRARAARERRRNEQEMLDRALSDLRAGDATLAEKLDGTLTVVELNQQLEHELTTWRHADSIAPTVTEEVPQPPPAEKDDAAFTAWRAVERSTNRKALQAFIDLYPKDRHVRAARERIRQLEEAERHERANARKGDEMAAWNRAVLDGSEAAWLQFLQDFREGFRAKDAIQMLAEVRDFERARQANNERGWRVYLATWPHGRHHDDAEEGLRLLFERPRAAAIAVPSTVMAELPKGETLEHMVPAAEPNVVDDQPQRQRQWIYIAAGVVALLSLVLILWLFRGQQQNDAPAASPRVAPSFTAPAGAVRTSPRFASDRETAGR